MKMQLKWTKMRTSMLRGKKGKRDKNGCKIYERAPQRGAQRENITKSYFKGRKKTRREVMSEKLENSVS